MKDYIRYIPNHHGGSLWKGVIQIGRTLEIKKLGEKPEIKFFSDVTSFSWEELDDICQIIHELNIKTKKAYSKPVIRTISGSVK